MKKLFLFDIDGTLVIGSHQNRFTRTINKVHNLNIDSDQDFSGYTDYLILATLLEGEGWSKEEIKSAMPKLLIELDRLHEQTFKGDKLRLLPGVPELLKALSKRDVVIGLITGNLVSIAERKLKLLKVLPYFFGGGFGSDPHETRGDLVSLAIKRAGFEDNLDGVYVIGDTVRDIKAAHDAGVINSVGVSNGFVSTKILKEAGAKIVFKDLSNTKKVLETFGIS